MPCCAFMDCGDPTCHLCALARASSDAKIDRMDEGKRNARPDFKAKRETSQMMPKKKHRVGPHR